MCIYIYIYVAGDVRWVVGVRLAFGAPVVLARIGKRLERTSSVALFVPPAQRRVEMAEGQTW